jgi:hypothetical protein
MAAETTELTREHARDLEHRHPAGGGGPGEGAPEDLQKTSLVTLVRELADDTRTLIQQEIELAKMEAAATAKRVAIDSAWIGAGVFVIATGGLCLVLAMALGVGALIGSYWLGTLITGAVLFLLGALFAWKGIRDLKKGGFAPSDTMGSLQEDREWAEQEVDDLKQAFRKETA